MTEQHKFAGCPFCGSQPDWDVVKLHNCGEPIFKVSVKCKGCGISMSAAATDDEHDKASRINLQRYKRNEPLTDHGTLVAHVVINNRLMRRWNTRAAPDELEAFRSWVSKTIYRDEKAKGPMWDAWQARATLC